MTQYSRPSSDELLSNFTGSYTDISEETYDDGDYITGDDANNGEAEFGLSSLSTPTVDTGHIVRFRAWQENQSNQRTLLVELLQGSTVISSYNSGSPFNLVKGTPTPYNWTLTEGEAQNITDYTDLRLEFTSGGTVSPPPGNRAYIYVSWAELEVPDSGTPTSDNQSAFLHGAETDLDSQIAYTHGKDSNLDSQAAYLEGEGSTASPAAAMVWFIVPPKAGDLGSDSQIAYLAGKNSNLDNQSAFLLGKDTILDNQSAFVQGKDTSTDSQISFLQGKDTDLDNQSAFIQGSNDTSDNQIAYLEGSAQQASDNQTAYLAGKDSEIDSQSSYVEGQDTDLDSQTAYLDGSDTSSDNQIAFLGGQDTDYDNQPAFLFSANPSSDSQEAYTSGISTAQDSQIAFVQGKDIESDFIPAYAEGCESASSDTPAYACGGINVTDFTSAYLGGQDTDTSSISAYLNSTGQILVPDADNIDGNWINEASGTNLYPSLADDSDSTYVWIDSGQVGSTFTVDISGEAGKDGDERHFLLWRIWNKGQDGEITLKCEIYDDTTLVKTVSKVLTNNVMEYIVEFSQGEIDNITSYANLKAKITIEGVA